MVTTLVSQNPECAQPQQYSSDQYCFCTQFAKLKVSEQKISYLFDQLYFGKLFIFLLSFDEIIYIDSDVLLCRSMDHLFETIGDQPDVIRASTDLLFSQRNNTITFIQRHSRKINSGVVCCKPGPKTFDQIVALVNASSLEDIQQWYGDQGVFNALLAQRVLRLNPLPYTYNAVSAFLGLFVNMGVFALKDIYIVHFILQPKPWGEVELKEFNSDLEKFMFFEWRRKYEKYLFSVSNRITNCYPLKTLPILNL